MLDMFRATSICIAMLTSSCEGVPTGKSEANMNFDGTWQSVIPCEPGLGISTRFPKLIVEGNTAYLTNFGTYAETHKSVINNGSAEFSGTYDRENGSGSFSARVKLLDNGEAYISGKRGPNFCKGTLTALQETAVNELGIVYVPAKVQACTPLDVKDFVATRENLLRQSKLRRLKDVTIVSKDKFGVFVVYLDKYRNSLGFMLDNLVSDVGDERKKTNDWSVGKVRVRDNQFCRVWSQWRTGYEENCWQVHKTPKDKYYFVCSDTLTYDGSEHLVLQGNVFDAQLVGGEHCKEISFEATRVSKECYVEFDPISVGAFGF